MEYRGCGASLSLQINVTNPAELDTLHAFGRFEVVAEPAIADGERVDWTVFSSDLRSKTNAFGMWLQGHRQVDEVFRVSAASLYLRHRTVRWHFILTSRALTAGTTSGTADPASKSGMNSIDFMSL